MRPVHRVAHLLLLVAPAAGEEPRKETLLRPPDLLEPADGTELVLTARDEVGNETESSFRVTDAEGAPLPQGP